MSSDIKVGDTVKATITGKVEDVNPGGGVLLADWDYYLYPNDGVTFEKIAPPLPTTPGSVIRGARTGKLYFRTHRAWLNEFGETATPIVLNLYDVIFDAGKKKS